MIAPKITTIMPCYNVEKYCRAVIEEILKYTDSLILIDDGSVDGTGAILQEFQEKKPKQIHLIPFSKNQGKGACLLKGIEYALSSIVFDVLITIDSDGQHVPSDIPKFIDLIKQGANLVIGCRDFQHMPFRRRFANTLMTFLLHRVYPNALKDTQSGFRAFSRKLVEKILQQVSGCRYEMEFRCILLALRDGDTVRETPIQTIYLDKNSSSHFSSIRDSFLILKVLFHHWRSKSL